MRKILLVLSCIAAAAQAKSEFLVVSEDAIMSTILLQDYRNKIKKFMEKFEESKKAIEKKLRASRIALEKLKDKPEFAKKEAEWQKQVEAYERKVAALSQAAEEATRDAGEKINSMINVILADISKKHESKPIFKEAALLYLPEGYTNVTGELVDSMNKTHKTISVALPMVSLE